MTVLTEVLKSIYGEQEQFLLATSIENIIYGQAWRTLPNHLCAVRLDVREDKLVLGLLQAIEDWVFGYRPHRAIAISTLIDWETKGWIEFLGCLQVQKNNLLTFSPVSETTPTMDKAISAWQQMPLPELQQISFHLLG